MQNIHSFSNLRKETQPKEMIQEQKQTLGFYALIVAAGKGQRFEHDIPKQYHEIKPGLSVLRQTINQFIRHPHCKGIKAVINPYDQHLYETAVDGLDILDLSNGGKDRKSSVYNGLKDLSYLNNEDIIFIHDAARPLVQKADIDALLKALETRDGATLCHGLSDTVLYKDGSAFDRDQLWASQTPQAFRYKTIIQAHENFQDTEATDDAGLVRQSGVHVEFAPGSRLNFKITTQDDLTMAKAILNNAEHETRTGLGFDVHAFDDAQTDNIRLGGIDIPFDRKLKGHSDADVALHTITDALLGAIGAGDIGMHFPPSDATYKDMDSSIFLKKAVELIENKEGSIINIDLTIICEKPRVGPYAPKMRQRIAEICSIAEGRINVKATTTEKLGFAGREEGIAAQAIASVRLPPAHEDS